MEQKIILEQLEQLCKNNSTLTDSDKQTIKEAISLIKKSSSKEQLLRAVELLVKLLGIGSNYF